MRVKIIVEGATSDEIARGIAAAEAVFVKVGITPLRAAEARFNVEGWDDRAFVDPIDNEDLELSGVWDEADTAALEACCSDWDEERKPATANLELIKVSHGEPIAGVFAKRPDNTGMWEVYNIETGQTVILDGEPFNEVDEREADDVVDLLNVGYIEPDRDEHCEQGDDSVVHR